MRIWVTALVLLLSPSAGAGDQPIWLVVTRPALTGAIGPLAEKRREDGFEVVLSTQPVSDALRALRRRPACILLVGDDQPGMEGQPWYVPARRMKLYRWRSVQRREYASDAAWADWNGDLIPDAPVGRIPARSSEEVALMVRKILAHEKRPPSPGDLRAPIWTGAAGYNVMINTLQTGFALNLLRMSAPGWLEPWLIAGDARHALCGWAPEQPALFSREMRRGGVLSVLMGHGNEERFFSMNFRGRRIWYTAEAAGSALGAGPPAMPLVIMACSCGRFDGPRGSLAESLLLLPGGPVAAIAATTESHPLPNYYTSVNLLQCMKEGYPTIGSLWLETQRRARKAKNFLMERLLRDIEGKLEDEIDVEKLKRDQMLLYALLGDPATRVRLPLSLKASIRHTEKGWAWEAEKPEGAARLHVTIRAPARELQPVEGEPPREEARALLEQANRTFEFEEVAEIPAGEPWRGWTRRRGRLRLVATGKTALHVAVFDIQSE